LVLGAALALAPLSAQERTAVGSWFGRATPVNPICPPGSAGCPIPHEIVMLPSFFSDGNFIGIDSQVFSGFHSTAHGKWVRERDDQVSADFMWLQSAPGDLTKFEGAFRVGLTGQLDPRDPNRMIGQITPYFFPFVGPNNLVILSPNGLPVPDPLGAPLPAACSPAAGCLGVFQFTLRRIGGEPLPPGRRVEFTANPNPIVVTDGTGLGATTLSWNAPGAGQVEIRIGSPTGTSMGRSGASGTTVTGKWVNNGMTFYLQDVSDGRPLTPANTLATVTVSVTNR
jgi:hypothetical protein